MKGGIRAKFKPKSKFLYTLKLSNKENTYNFNHIK